MGAVLPELICNFKEASVVTGAVTAVAVEFAFTLVEVAVWLEISDACLACTVWLPKARSKSAVVLNAVI